MMILWFIISSLLIIEYAPMCKDLTIGEQAIVFIILVVGGPILSLASILMAILSCIMPEGWDDDDDTKKL